MHSHSLHGSAPYGQRWWSLQVASLQSCLTICQRGRSRRTFRSLISSEGFANRGRRLQGDEVRAEGVPPVASKWPPRVLDPRTGRVRAHRLAWSIAASQYLSAYRISALVLWPFYRAG